MQLKRPTRHLVAALAALAAGGSASAADSTFVGPRGLGMGGANVASVDDGTAQYYNPAAFGFFGRRNPDGTITGSDNNDLGRRRWGIGAEVAAGMGVHGDFGVYLNDLAEEQDAIDQFSGNGVTTGADLDNLVRIGNALANIDNPGNAVRVDGGGDLNVRFGHWAIGARGSFDLSGRVTQSDLVNVGIEQTGASFAQTIIATGAADDGSVQLLTGLSTAQGGQFDFSDPDELDAAQKLDFAARQNGVSAAEAVDLTTLLNNSAAAYGDPAREFGNNTTAVTLYGLGLGEIPVSYGYAFDHRFAVGATVKGMLGRVYATSIDAFSDSEGLDNLTENAEQSFNVGLDLAAMVRLPMVNVGLTGRNLNNPKFEGPTVGGIRYGDVTVERQVTVGVAFMPLRTLTFEIDLDLLDSATTLVSYDVRNLMLGAEWNLWRTLALRVGAYQNLAEDDIGWVYTAGVGVNLWAVRLDVAAGLSPERSDFDGDEVPSEARGAVRLASEW
jgi:hypothetical protein